MPDEPHSKSTFLNWLPLIVVGLTGAISVGVLEGKSSTHDKQINDNAAEIAKMDRLIDKAVVDIAVTAKAVELMNEFRKERQELLNQLAQANAKIELLEHKK